MMPHYTLTLSGRWALLASAILVLVGFAIGKCS